MKKQKGITLIALIITIIVMLILVGVSVTVALNGGLFTTAKEASSKTELESEKERLLEITMGTLNDKGKVDSDKLETAINASEDFEIVNKEAQIYKGLKTGTAYEIGTYGSITIKEGIICPPHSMLPVETVPDENRYECEFCGYTYIACDGCGENGEYLGTCGDECEICGKIIEHDWITEGYDDNFHECNMCGGTGCHYFGDNGVCILCGYDFFSNPNHPDL